MKKSILFDLDGTLTDSGEGIMKSMVYALSHFGIEEPSQEQLRTVVGPPLSDIFIRFGIPKDSVEEAIEIYRSRYIPIGRFENHPYPGIRELLEQLRSDGHKLYIATSKPEWMSVEILEYFDLAKYFDLICGATVDQSRNSKEAVIAHLLSQCDVNGHAIMVGDTAYDVIGAKAHNIPCVGVSWGYGSIADMKREGAVSIADTVDELYALLK